MMHLGRRRWAFLTALLVSLLISVGLTLIARFGYLWFGIADLTLAATVIYLHSRLFAKGGNNG